MFIIKTVASFFNTHFEALGAVIVYFFIGSVVVVVSARVRHLGWVYCKDRLKNAVFLCLAGFQGFLVLLFVSLFLVNLGEKPPLDFSASVLSSTEWVEDDFPVYFISSNQLVSIQPNGEGRRVVLELSDVILEYHFSPDGKFILVLTQKELLLLDKAKNTARVIASLKSESGTSDLRGVINGLQWAPDSQKFCYCVARWSPVASQDQWLIYNIATQSKQKIMSPAFKIGSLAWGQQGKNLYYVWFDALDTSVRGNPYEVKVVRVSLETLKPEQILKFPFDKAIIPDEHLALRGVKIFHGADHLSFGRAGEKHHSWVSAQGREIGIDEEDTLYYIHNRWWRRRLYQVPRVPEIQAVPHHQYAGGKLAIQHMRWFPSGKYVLMEHYFLGSLIMDPATGKTGILVNEKGNTFGWYVP